MSPSDEISAFIDFCVRLRSAWRHYEILFEEGDLRRELLRRVAPTFFGDVNQMFIEHLILQVCRLTDPEKTHDRSNVTVKRVLSLNDSFSESVENASLTLVSDRIHAFRSEIEPARNRLIGHLDRDSVIAGQPLGGASADDWQRFWDDLDEFVHVIHTRYIDPTGTFRLNDIGMISDADSVVKALKKSTYFDQALGRQELTQALSQIAFSSEYTEA